MAEGGVTFRFDANIPAALPEALRVRGEPAEHASEIFARRLR
jgi:hypothetical protein